MSEFIKYEDIQVGDHIRVVVEYDYRHYETTSPQVSSTNVYEGEVTGKDGTVLAIARSGGLSHNLYHENPDNVKTSYARIEPPIKEGYWVVRGGLHADLIRERRDGGWYMLEGLHLPTADYPRSRLVKYLGNGE